MLAPMTEIDLPSCSGFLVPAFSYLHSDIIRLHMQIYLKSKMNSIYLWYK